MHVHSSVRTGKATRVQPLLDNDMYRASSQARVSAHTISVSETRACEDGTEKKLNKRATGYCTTEKNNGNFGK